jgi:predicted amidohydrolase
MQDLKVTLVQANQIWENKTANFSNYLRLLAEVEQTDLIILPEMFHTGFTMNVTDLAEEMESSEGIRWLKELANSKESAVYTSLIIYKNDNYYNRGVFVFPNGTIEFYDKRKRFSLAGESAVFAAGTTSKVVDYKGWKINLQICFDLRFPEVSLNSLDDAINPFYDVSIYVANWPEKRIVHWNCLLPARAIENQCYVIGLNRFGKDGNGINYSGDSCVLDALGTDLLHLENENVASVLLSSESLLETRKTLPFLKERIL